MRSPVKKILWIEMCGEEHVEANAIPREVAIPPGSAFVIASLHARGYEVDSRTWNEITPPTDHCCVMCSFMYVRQFIYVPELLRRLGGKPKIPMIAGGHGIHNPVPWARVFDRVVIGDGETITPDLVEDLEKWDDSPFVYPNKVGFIKKRAEPPNKLITTQYSSHVRTIEICRGCRSKCAFCELGWTHEYRRATQEDVKECIETEKRASSIHWRVGRSIARPRDCIACAVGIF